MGILSLIRNDGGRRTRKKDKEIVIFLIVKYKEEVITGRVT